MNDEATDPTRFPYSDGETFALPITAEATSAVPCPHCAANAGQPCRFEPHQEKVATGMVHRSRFRVNLDIIRDITENG